MARCIALGSATKSQSGTEHLDNREGTMQNIFMMKRMVSGKHLMVDMSFSEGRGMNILTLPQVIKKAHLISGWRTP